MIYCKKSFPVGISKTAGWIFTKLKVGTSKPLDVQCKFMFKSGHKILSYLHFKILVQECTGGGDGIDPELSVSSLHISVAIKAGLLILNMFNIYKNNISKMFFSFFLTSKLLI